MNTYTVTEITVTQRTVEAEDEATAVAEYVAAHSPTDTFYVRGGAASPDERGEWSDLANDLDDSTAYHPGDVCDQCGGLLRSFECPTCVQCSQCEEPVGSDGDHGMCGSCLHNALRSGWSPGE